MRLSSKCFAVLAAAVAVTSPAYADTMRCGGSLIELGALAGFVAQKCGAPESREEVSEPVRARRANGTSYETGDVNTREIWHYSRGSRQFPAILTFEGGVLKKLEFLK